MNIKCFLDFEMNTVKSHCRNKDEVALIQIAYVFTDDKYNVLKSNSIFVKPWNNDGILTDNMKDISNITQEDIDKGLILYEAINMFYHDIDIMYRNAYDIEFYTYGNFDRYAYNINMKYYKEYAKENNLPYYYKPVSKYFIDVQADIRKMLCWRKDVSLKTLCDIAGVNKDGQHEAMYDAMSLMEVSKYLGLERYTFILKKSNGELKMCTGLKPRQHEIELQRKIPSTCLCKDVAKYLATTNSNIVTETYNETVHTIMLRRLETNKTKNKIKR